MHCAHYIMVARHGCHDIMVARSKLVSQFVLHQTRKYVGDSAHLGPIINMHKGCRMQIYACITTWAAVCMCQQFYDHLHSPVCTIYSLLLGQQTMPVCLQYTLTRPTTQYNNTISNPLHLAQWSDSWLYYVQAIVAYWSPGHTAIRREPIHVQECLMDLTEIRTMHWNIWIQGLYSKSIVLEYNENCYTYWYTNVMMDNDLKSKDYIKEGWCQKSEKTKNKTTLAQCNNITIIMFALLCLVHLMRLNIFQIWNFWSIFTCIN